MLLPSLLASDYYAQLLSDVTTVVRDVITRTGDVNEDCVTSMSSMSGSVSGSGGGTVSAPRYDVTRCGSQPLKPAKKYRSESDSDKQIVRCKRKLDFIANGVDDSGTTKPGGRQGRGGGGGSGTRRAASIARRNERERKRVSLINRTFETLRDQLPVSLWGHRNLAKVSKVETLRAAIGYIRTLEDLLAADDNEDEHLVEMLSSAERLASLSGDDRHVDVTQISSSPRLQLAAHPTFHAADTAASACERLEHLSSGVATTHVDIHSATRRLCRLSAPAQRPVTQQSFYDVTGDLPGPRSLQPDNDDDSLLLDINCNYDNVRQLSSLKPADDDVIRQLVTDNFIFDNVDFSATVGS